MDQQRTFCCVQCRLLQPPTSACSECGTSMVAPVELVRELLHYRDMKMVRGRDWAFITAMIAGGSIAFPMLAPFALGSMAALGISKVREVRQRRTIAGVELPAIPRASNATTITGIARRFRATVASAIRDAQVLAEHALVTDADGGVLIRRATSAPFLLDRGAQAGPLLVTGAVRVTAAGVFGSAPVRERVGRGDPRLARMGVPRDLAIAGELSASALVEDDALTIAVTGVIEDEAVADLAFHRDAGTIAVMRGTPGAPVLVEDPRLAGAALVR